MENKGSPVPKRFVCLYSYPHKNYNAFLFLIMFKWKHEVNQIIYEARHRQFKVHNLLILDPQ